MYATGGTVQIKIHTNLNTVNWQTNVSNYQAFIDTIPNLCVLIAAFP